MADSQTPVIITRDLYKTYISGTLETPVLKGIDMQVDAGEFVSVVGASGSGKTTLLNILGTLDRATSGLVIINGHDVSQMDDIQLAHLRGETIGFTFQFHYLLDEFTVLENALMPAMVRRGAPTREDIQWVRYILDRVGMSDRLDYYPSQISGGQAQRVAIVRALTNRPRLVLADEPTGNLDSANGRAVFEVMLELNQQIGTSFLLVTHDEQLAGHAECQIQLADGMIVQDTCRHTRTHVRLQY